ncbi:Clc protein-like family-containing protein [Aphelenchoides bicaudatus]|nr:Clc protein-like family-containing protein [Aphelenchoides bicaudatus]
MGHANFGMHLTAVSYSRDSQITRNGKKALFSRSSCAAAQRFKMFQLDFSTRLAKLQATTFVLTAISNAFCFFATITPSWQVAEDLDANRKVESGLWMYCQTNQACWYIFSGWHYAVLIMMISVMVLVCISLASIAAAYFMPRYRKIATIVMDSTLGFAFILLGIALAVFMINAEMLESKYLIGINNTYPKEYGYSFYLGCFGLTIMLFAILAAVICTTYTLFASTADAGPISYDPRGYEFDARGNVQPSYTIMKQQTTFPNYPPSEASTLQTRTFLSY